ncbi:ABC transporter permease [Brevibacillus choshinensis]|uniref:ABC transporter permease n=1 Tax=Brevibacillus choshinensis TaxID=54911 RepID=UPI002E2062B1
MSVKLDIEHEQKRMTPLPRSHQTTSPNRKRIILRRIVNNRLALIGIILVSLVIMVAILAPVLAPFDPLEMKVQDRLKAPSAEHWFGTDDFGRDVLSRVIYGSQTSMMIGATVVVITSILGLVLGLYSAYYRHLDNLLMRISDGLMAFPAILLAIAIMAAMGPRIESVITALSIVYTPTVARTVRSAALVLRELTYIEAIRSLGGKPWRIIWLHIAPNCLSPLIVQATFIFAYAIIIEASLSFLGAGTPPPAPSWGNIINDGKTLLREAWWMSMFPGIAIMITVLGLNLLGDGLRDLLDPHTSKSKK